METVATTRSKEQLLREIDDLRSQVGRLIQERQYFRGQAKKWYERNRLLENRVRDLDASYYGSMLSMQLDLTAIAKRLPLKPRKKWGWGQDGSL